jgi:hypothetical protein
MKRISLIILGGLALVLLVSAYGQRQQSGPVKTVQVTAQAVASQPAGKTFSLDLTRNGKIYEIPEGVDYGRLEVRTSGGKLALSALVRKPGVTGKLLLGTYDDLSTIDFGFPPGGGPVQPGSGPSEVKCYGSVCSCISGTDCRDLAKTGKCVRGGGWTCAQYNGHYTCWCAVKAGMY